MRIFLMMCAVVLLPPLVFAQSAPLSFEDVYGTEKSAAGSPDQWGTVTLLSFWRADCAPCIREISVLKKIASAHPKWPIVLVSLENAQAAQPYLTGLPASIHMLVVKGNAEQALARFGNTQKTLPFNVALHKDGSVCARRYGILGSDIARDWIKRC